MRALIDRRRPRPGSGRRGDDAARPAAELERRVARAGDYRAPAPAAPTPASRAPSSDSATPPVRRRAPEARSRRPQRRATGCPSAIRQALAANRVVVVALYDPKAKIDDTALREARAGAQLAGDDLRPDRRDPGRRRLAQRALRRRSRIRRCSSSDRPAISSSGSTASPTATRSRRRPRTPPSDPVRRQPGAGGGGTVSPTAGLVSGLGHPDARRVDRPRAVRPPRPQGRPAGRDAPRPSTTAPRAPSRRRSTRTARPSSRGPARTRSPTPTRRARSSRKPSRR